MSGRRQTFCSCGLPSSELMCVHALCALLRPLLGQAPNPESGLTVVFRARCGLTSSRAYVLSGGCSARAGGRFALLRRSVGSLGGHPPQTPGSCLTVVFCAHCGLTSSCAYVLSGGCSAGVIGRFCVGLSPRPAALRSAAFALNARPLAGCRPRPLFRLSDVLFNVCCGCSARAVGRFCVFRSFVFFMVIRVM